MEGRIPREREQRWLPAADGDEQGRFPRHGVRVAVICDAAARVVMQCDPHGEQLTEKERSRRYSEGHPQAKSSIGGVPSRPRGGIYHALTYTFRTALWLPAMRCPG